jgi:hypothetical protein
MTKLANTTFATKFAAMALSAAFSAVCLGSVLGGMQTAAQPTSPLALRTVELPAVIVIGHKQPQMNMIAASVSTLPGKI